MYKKLEKKNFTIRHCWLKLNGQPKWNLFIAKTAAQANEEETDDPTDPTQEPPKKVRRFLRGKKREEDSAKREGAVAKLKERFEDILSKEACVNLGPQGGEKGGEVQIVDGCNGQEAQARIEEDHA